METHTTSVGVILKLEMPVLGNNIGDKGVCYETYTLGGRSGYSFIFPNGRYDGFSEKEIDMFFDDDFSDFSDEISSYQFTNVIQLSKDFRNGKFNSVFE